MRFFNTAGPVRCKNHYCLPPLTRFDLEEVLLLIEQQKYFVLHAPRQTGKTSCLQALMDYLNQEGKYRCLYMNVEAAQAARENIMEGMRCILNEMASRARYHLNDSFIYEIYNDVLSNSGIGSLNEILSIWSMKSDKPLILFIDEIDSLIGDTLVSVLRQLRSGYDKRPKQFPQTIILCGVRDVRDYRIHSNRENAVITGGSAFNIKAESLRLGDFSKQEVEMLYKYHTEETGQMFDSSALNLVWEFSDGQPWIVNALGYEVCFKMKENRNRTIRITSEMVNQAKEDIIARRETHIDQLVDKLKEERVRRVIEPILVGDNMPENISNEDLMYLEDLGLIKRKGMLRIANKIYQEVIPRELTFGTQHTISEETEWYVKDDGLLDMNKLLSSFQDFFRQHSEIWVEKFDYKEAGPQLLMQAFLQRIINSGGEIHREYGLGRKRTDLLILWKRQKVVIELKIRYGDLEKTITEGLSQTYEYMDKCGANDGHLVIFDRDKKKSWDEKIFSRKEIFKGKELMVWGL